MQLKIILCLVLVLSGGLAAFARTPIPPVETIVNSVSGSTISNQWSGRTFSEILPPGQIKTILLLDDSVFQNLYLPKPTAQETQSYYNQLFNHLECSTRKTGVPYLADNEMTRAQFAVINRSGDIFRIQALSKMGPGAVSSLLISGHGLETRMDITDFQPSPVTNPPAVAAQPALPAVETDYLFDQTPGDWAGRRFAQILPPKKIKRIILLDEFTDLLDYVPPTPAVVAQQQRQMCYESLFNHFEASRQTARTNSMSKDEVGLAKLILITDSGQVVYLEIIGVSGRIENGKIVGNHIAGVLLHGPSQGVRIDLNIPPATTAK